MSKFVKAWRKHLHESIDDETLRRNVLNEITEDEYEYIKNWMRDAPEEAYSFNNLFDGKKRIAITPPPPPAGGAIGSIMTFFKDNGYTIDFKDSTVSKDITTTIPKGPKAGETVTQTKKIRIGKAFDMIDNLIKQYYKVDKEYQDAGGMAAEVATLATGFDSTDPDDKRLRKAMDDNEAMEQKIKSYLSDTRVFNFPKIQEQIPQWKKFWNEKSSFYRENPDAAFKTKSPYVTILSRHPVDVVRMSDMQDIRSCHSRGGGYFQCAVAESRGHGPIAYLVPREQFENYFDVDLDETDAEKVDLDQGGEEIFADNDRGIPGLNPKSRIRLRKFVSDEDGTMLAVPEKRTYTAGRGTAPVGFLKSVVDWARDSQEEAIGDVSKLAKEIYDEKWTRYGGSYADTNDGELFAAMFKDVADAEALENFTIAGDVGAEEEDEEEIESELSDVEERVEREAEEIQQRADQTLEYFNVYHDVQDDGDGPYVNYGGSFSFDTTEEFGEYIDDDPDNPFPIGWAVHEKQINDAVKQALDQEAYFYIDFDGNINDDGKYFIDISMGYDDTSDVDGFQSFVNQMINGDDGFDLIMNNVREQLEKEEIIKPAADIAVKALKSLDNYKATINPEEKEITVTWKKPNKISNDLREFKQFSAEDQDTIKKLWARDYRDSLANILNNLRKKINFPLKNIVLSTERQKLSPELDGVYGIMDFDLLYFDDREMMLAAKMLEEMNKQSYNQSLRQTSANEYYDLLKSAEKGEPPFSKKTNESKKVTNKALMENWKRYLGK
jgi:hypothetical protein